VPRWCLGILVLDMYAGFLPQRKLMLPGHACATTAHAAAHKIPMPQKTVALNTGFKRRRRHSALSACNISLRHLKPAVYHNIPHTTFPLKPAMAV